MVGIERSRPDGARAALVGGSLALLLLVGTTVIAASTGAADTTLACRATLEAEGYTWDGAAQSVGPFDAIPVLVCLASGPPERLPVSNAIGCLLVNEEPTPVEDGDFCTGVLFARRDSERTLVWVQNDSAVSVWVTPLEWNGSGFDRKPPFLACKSPVDPMPLEPAVGQGACDLGG